MPQPAAEVEARQLYRNQGNAAFVGDRKRAPSGAISSQDRHMKMIGAHF